MGCCNTGKGPCKFPNDQEKTDTLVAELLKRGVNVDDRDAVTGQTLLHFVAKAGAPGMGFERLAPRVIADLLSRGADVDAVCSWKSMTPLHIAAYFGCEVTTRSLCASKASITATCSQFQNATPLHLAAMAGSVAVVTALLELKSDPRMVDALGRTPRQAAQLVKDENDSADMGVADITEVINVLTVAEGRSPVRSVSRIPSATPRTPASAGVSRPSSIPSRTGSTLSPGVTRTTSVRGAALTPRAVEEATPSSGRPSSGLRKPSVMLDFLLRAYSSTPRASSGVQLAVGSRVLVGTLLGVLRYIGSTDFGDGVFLGIGDEVLFVLTFRAG